MPLIVGGSEVSCPSAVRDWTETGLEVRPWKGARPRRKLIDMIILHWTAAENPPEAVFRNLQRRGKHGLGVEFCIGREGDIWQFCDPCEVDAWDAGFVNPRSIGVEIVNYGMRWPSWTRWSLGKVAEVARDRPIEETRIRGRRRFVAGFYPEQVGAVLDLVDALLEALPSIPATVPLDPDGRAFSGTLSRRLVDALPGGILGHYMVSSRKSDPGPILMETVREHIAPAC